MSTNCECADPGCPNCKGDCSEKATRVLFRVDMEDHTGTLMCTECADDAYVSGLFDAEVISLDEEA